MNIYFLSCDIHHILYLVLFYCDILYNISPSSLLCHFSYSRSLFCPGSLLHHYSSSLLFPLGRLLPTLLTTFFPLLSPLSLHPSLSDQAVQQVVTNLQLSHIELRSENSIDIQPYTHQRKVELSVVPLEGDILVLKNAFLKVRHCPMHRLVYQPWIVYTLTCFSHYSCAL